MVSSRFLIGLLLLSLKTAISAPSLTVGDLPTEVSAAPITSGDGRITLQATASLQKTTTAFGITGGTNDAAIDDADGQAPADESLQLEFAPDAGLTGLDVVWTRGELRLSGFASDPQADTGSYDAQSGTWTFFQPWTSWNPVAYRFLNPDASRGQTLTLEVLDQNQGSPQVSLRAIHTNEDAPSIPHEFLAANTSVTYQTFDHFGASMLWTIDPTAGWPVETREALALKLVSEAGGIGLTNLRFDFGGGDTGTGVQTVEPWTWRFPEAMKDGPDAPFDWTRRAGQQWFLRRAHELGIAKLSMAAISPPWWMTKNGRSYCSPEIGSTNLDPDKVGEFATYLAEVVAHFRDNEGIIFDEVSPLNEPEWDWEYGSQEGCRYTAADARPLVMALHQELSNRGLASDCKILLGEHGMINAALEDSYHQQYNGSIWNGGNNSAGYGKYREFLSDLQGHPDLTGLIEPVSAYHSYFNDSVGTLNSNLRDLLRQNADDYGLGLVQSEYCILGSYGPVRDLQFDPAR
ncbi:MAG: glycoside hydrolase, partial [Verrucomicrobiota bacterium]